MSAFSVGKRCEDADIRANMLRVQNRRRAENRVQAPKLFLGNSSSLTRRLKAHLRSRVSVHNLLYIML
jgi:hypothetical protein